MTAFKSFYFSKILNMPIIFPEKIGGKKSGKIKDLIVDTNSSRPKAKAIKIKIDNQIKYISASSINIIIENNKYSIRCDKVEETEIPEKTTLMLAKHILDKQVVDVSGKKVVRVNDLRLAILSTGIYLIAVDVGLEGLLRRLGVKRPINSLLKFFNNTIPTKLVPWEEVEAINFTSFGIQLSKPFPKLNTMHASDLADILEDLDRQTRIAIFSSLDEERAADVLEELRTEAQINVIENLPLDKAADVLEKMPADEAADILDEIQDDIAEELLRKMETEASTEVRELLEYSEDEVGSLMSTDFISFNQSQTVDDTIKELRKLKPPADTIYYLYVLDDFKHLVATVSLRDLIISEPEIKLKQIMNTQIKFVYDEDDTESLAELISKYNLLSLPVVDKEKKLIGVVIINDVVEKLVEGSFI